jgi:hypothetical protein
LVPEANLPPEILLLFVVTAVLETHLSPAKG